MGHTRMLLQMNGGNYTTMIYVPFLLFSDQPGEDTR